MMKKITKQLKVFSNSGIAILFALGSLTVSAGSDQHKHEQEEKSSVGSLSNEVRGLLAQEMQFIDKAMKEMFSAYISGDWETIAKLSKQVEESFILKQKLTKHQKHELHEKLPKKFLMLDQQFHYYAGMLSHVAENEKTELVGFYYSKMQESCLGCHSQFATERFEKLNKSNKKEAEHSH